MPKGASHQITNHLNFCNYYKSQEKWPHATVDFIKPLPRSEKENYGFLVVVDRLSKMNHADPFAKYLCAPEAA